MKRNLDHTALPTTEEIKLYQEGKLSPQRTHEIEILAEENPMLGDALEGYSALPLFASVPGVSAAVSQQAASGGMVSGAKGLAALTKSGTAFWHLNGWVIGVAVGISGALIAVALNKEDNESVSSTIQPSEIRAVTENQTDGAQDQVKTADYRSEIETKNGADNHTTLKTERNDQNNSDFENTGIHVAQNKPSDELSESLSTKAIENNVLVDNEKNTPNGSDYLKPNNSSLVAIGMVTIHNHRIADYTDYRRGNWQPLQLSEIGLSANYADYQSRSAEAENPNEISIPYLEYIDQCILAYKQGEYKTAIKGFLTVLNQYTDDINAQFYGAMSYYHHDQPVLALELLEKAEKNPIRAFREETYFYKAKCLKMLNRTDEATLLFKQIVIPSCSNKL